MAVRIRDRSVWGAYAAGDAGQPLTSITFYMISRLRRVMFGTHYSTSNVYKIYLSGQTKILTDEAPVCILYPVGHAQGGISKGAVPCLSVRPDSGCKFESRMTRYRSYERGAGPSLHLSRCAPSCSSDAGCSDSHSPLAYYDVFILAPCLAFPSQCCSLLSHSANIFNFSHIPPPAKQLPPIPKRPI